MRAADRDRDRMRVPPRIEGRLPPHDLDAEAAMLSAILIEGSGEALDAIIDIAKPEHQYSEAHRQIFAACIELRREGKPCDVVQVGAWLKSRERIAQVGGMGYLTEILNAAPAITRVRDYALVVRDKWVARQAILVHQEQGAIGYLDYGNAREYAAKGAERLAALVNDDAVDTLEHIRPILKKGMAEATAAARAGVRVSGAPTGFHRYDRLTAGLHGGDLTIVAARPGMGKTSFALNAAVNVARGDSEHEPAGVAIFSLEMPREQCSARMACSEGRVDVRKLRAGEMTPNDWTRMTQSASFLSALPIWIDDDPSLTLMTLRAKLLRVKSDLLKRPVVDRDGEPIRDADGNVKTWKLGAAIVDYLQLMKGREDAQSREQEVSELSRGLKRFAKELGVPFVVLSQLNRAVETRSEKNKRPQLSDLRESGAIEQDADNIVFIYRDDYYNKEDSAERNIAELIIAKQRNGPTGTVKVRFDKEYTRFDNLAEGEYQDEV